MPSQPKTEVEKVGRLLAQANARRDKAMAALGAIENSRKWYDEQRRQMRETGG